MSSCYWTLPLECYDAQLLPVSDWLEDHPKKSPSDDWWSTTQKASIRSWVSTRCLSFLVISRYPSRNFSRRQHCLIKEKKVSNHDSSHEEIPGEQCSQAQHEEDQPNAVVPERHFMITHLSSTSILSKWHGRGATGCGFGFHQGHQRKCHLSLLSLSESLRKPLTKQDNGKC